MPNCCLIVNGQPPGGGAGGEGALGEAFVVDHVADYERDPTSELEAGDPIYGETLVAGETVLLAGQTAPAENGIYVVPASGAASRHASWSAAADFSVGRRVAVDSAREIFGAQVWTLTTQEPTVGVDPVLWAATRPARWGDQPTAWAWNDFLGSPANNWAVFTIGGGGIFQANADVVGRPGQIEIATGAIGRAGIRENISTVWPLGTGQVMFLECGIKLPATAPTVADDYLVAVGYLDTDLLTAITHGVWLEARRTSANWRAIVEASGAQTDTDTGVATATDTWVRLRIRIVDDTDVFFLIDDVLAHHETGANIPSGTGEAARVQFVQQRTASDAGANRSCFVDYAFTSWRVPKR